MANYLKELEKTLREKLTHNHPDEVVTWVKEEVLKSYKNGRASAIRGATSAGANGSRGERAVKHSSKGVSRVYERDSSNAR